jgi:CDP-diacylglycerol--serine O-phosphatidyltransferase
MRLQSQIPNALTLLNLFSGCIALVFAFNEQFGFAFFFVSLGIFFDFFDGFFARLLKVSSPLGLQLDSLADMVTSGVVPGIVMYKLLSNTVHNFGLSPNIAYLGFLITLGSCYRLANFNIDTRQTDSFIGLPTPANALFILSLPLVQANTDSFALLEIMITPWFLFAVIIFSVYMLNAEIPLFSLKVKKFSVKENALQLSFLFLSVILLSFLKYTGIPLVILLYILMSVLSNKLAKK